ncbi:MULTISPECIES: phosphoribosylamine--glycine ligase [Stappiaceae]|jgi:phosphoribosylamine---glycine ligase|uniref:phosphoribosylamine--glycine ligase n=1 Tax=Stappiaceae TaxID=2821832 RepID=UPI00094A9DD9|nr:MULTISPECIES: phosphoribosylamine--glycine ligase [Stappiaceae]MCR9281520.1 phosphoribosylamine--glycine ligase [Paracoccaceae bacterium]NKI58800.1 phosphoribosylamine--glycine ligase [Labrenzia sp. PO1]QFS95935.1 Phosphoribosylamine--glycine ligase [Labrenzia sp. THAF191b]QFT02250.1 Phosphoribosylamine--glycine ligase [Labrenzia sp. THAF191a]QFT13791.1 Phosphoribosylamine--glycine ligase [Labrenzia sp. THAF187b]
MKLLLIGSGGREHALAWALAKSPKLTKLYAAPGNAGIAEVAELCNLDTADHQAVIGFCREHAIDLVVVGPEAPLVAGLVDDLEAAGIKAFGPSRAAAQLEGSKAFTKGVCDEADIPTAGYGRFDTADAALAYVREKGAPIVVKADGLAAGKGVVVAMTLKDAEEAVTACFEGSFGAAGAEVVIEEFLEGEEASFFVLSDGTNALPLATAQDHKRAYDGDEGPNTGGMGAYSPAPVLTDALIAEVMRTIIEPTIATLAKRGTPFKGVLYAGLMIGKNGPKLIEYNTRFGDPECQVLMMRLKSDLLELLLASVEGRLDQTTADWRDEAALTVVMAAKGYPGSYDKGTEIRGLDTPATDDVAVFHAGTKRDGTQILANGGRVLNVTAVGTTVREAQQRAYERIRDIDWPEGFCRTDIGWRAIARES